MNPPENNLAAIYQTLAGRALSLGVLLWELDRNGVVVHGPAEPQALADWAVGDAIRQRLLALAADRPAACPEGVEIWPSARAWLLPDRLTGTATRLFAAVAFTPAVESVAPITGAGSGQDTIRAAMSRLAWRAGAAMPDVHSILRWTLDDLIQKGRLQETVTQFAGKLAQSYEEISLLFRLVRELNSVSDLLESLDAICRQLQQVLQFGWAAIRFHPHNTKLKELAGRLICTGEPPVDHDRMMQLTGDVLARWKQDDWTAVLTPENHELARAVGAEVIAEPITHDNQVVGALFAGNKCGGETDVSSDEMQFLDATADFLGIFHENMSRLIEQREMFMGTLRALVTAIDAKDPYTSGHSERVSLLMSQLAVAMELAPAQVEEYRIAGLVHDVGKIGVPEAVLRKPGRLTDEEFAEIKRHSQTGYNILKDVPLLGAALQTVLHHHERWDGRGYPLGLAGEDIPRMARAVALADTFDAMSSNRAYRPAMPREAVLAEIHRCAGLQFDPALAARFLTLDFTEFDRVLAVSASQAVAA